MTQIWLMLTSFGRSRDMNRPAKNPRPQNPVAVAMSKRHGTTTTKMRDRRAARGGAKKRDFMKDYE